MSTIEQSFDSLIKCIKDPVEVVKVEALECLSTLLSQTASFEMDNDTYFIFDELISYLDSKNSFKSDLSY